MTLSQRQSVNSSANVHHAIVKQVLSGDTIVVRSKSQPPREKTLILSNVTAPKLARRPQNDNPSSATEDEPYAWAAREFLRKRLVGTEICFIVVNTISNREYAFVYAGRDTSADLVASWVVSEGLAEVRRQNRPGDENINKLIALEDKARAEKLGKWSSIPTKDAVRDIKWTVGTNVRRFVDARSGKDIDAVVEHVRDGSTLRLFLLPEYYYVTIMLSGIKCPRSEIQFGGDSSPTPAEEFGNEARDFVDTRLLQRDVRVRLEGVNNNQVLCGTVIHPRGGNIALHLLSQGFARCVDWTMAFVSQTADYRNAEREAKLNRRNIWKNFEPIEQFDVNGSQERQSYKAHVLEIINPDTLLVETETGELKISLASIKGPRLPAGNEISNIKDKDSILYETPCMFEAREFLRRKLVGKRVYVYVDFIQPANGKFPEKTCCTVKLEGDINIGEVLVSKGYAQVIRHRQSDEHRARDYDALLVAEDKAIKSKVGMHHPNSKSSVIKVNRLNDSKRSNSFLPYLKRANWTQAVVEYVFSGSRYRVYIPSQTCLLTLLLGGVVCPKGERILKQGGPTIAAEPFGYEALLFTKSKCTQREVSVKIDNIDKNGNFIGWLKLDNREATNMSVELVRQGFASIHPSAEYSEFYHSLNEAQNQAKSARLRIWSKFDENIIESAEQITLNDDTERAINPIKVICTEISPDMRFYCQHYDKGSALEIFMEKMRDWINSTPPQLLKTVRPGDVVAARFSDGLWYRAKIERALGRTDDENLFRVMFIDYGNKQDCTSTDLRPLASEYSPWSLPAQAFEYTFAFCKLPCQEDLINECNHQIANEVLNKELQINQEYKIGNIPAVTLINQHGEDIGRSLIERGFLLAEKPRREARFATVCRDYQAQQEKAKNARLNIWRYGDITDESTPEFGLP